MPVQTTEKMGIFDAGDSIRYLQRGAQISDSEHKRKSSGRQVTLKDIRLTPPFFKDDGNALASELPKLLRGPKKSSEHLRTGVNWWWGRFTSIKKDRQIKAVTDYTQERSTSLLLFDVSSFSQLVESLSHILIITRLRHFYCVAVV